MANLYTLAAQFRSDLLTGQQEAATRMIGVYGPLYRRIQVEAKALLDALDAQEKATGQKPSAAYRRRRLEALKAQVLTEIHAFAAFADPVIAQCQRDAVYSAGDNARQLVFAGMGNPPGILPLWNALPAEALTHLVGFLSDGSPLSALLGTLGPEVAQGTQEAMTSGLALGHNPKRIASAIRQVAGLGLTRALTISRTETLRSYRAASLANYAANSDVVTGWEWTCSRSRRTCAVCLAMDGKVFPLDTPFGSHPNCRCCPVPCTASYADLGIDAPEPPTPKRQSGAEWFAAQDEAVQAQILGPGKLALYQEGKLTLGDLVQYRDDPQWGPTRTEKPLRELKT